MFTICIIDTKGISWKGIQLAWEEGGGERFWKTAEGLKKTDSKEGIMDDKLKKRQTKFVPELPPPSVSVSFYMQWV